MILVAIALVSIAGCNAETAPTANDEFTSVVDAPTTFRADKSIHAGDMTKPKMTVTIPYTSGSPAPAEAESVPLTIRIVSWNVESDGNDPNVIAKQLSDLKAADIYCLQEVRKDSFAVYAEALGDTFTSIESKSGQNDRLQILFNSKRFELLESKELDDINDGNHRSPLYVRLRDTGTEAEFVVMTNHLARGKATFRKQQAIKLREWARDASVTTSTIAIGDFNMDYTFATGKGNSAFPEMLRDNVP